MQKLANRREVILSTVKVLTASTAAATTPRAPQPTIPTLPTMPAGLDPELVDLIQFSYNWDMVNLANVVESAIQVHRVAPEWVTSGQMPEQLRQAILRDTGAEPFASECCNLAPLEPGYIAKMIAQEKVNLSEHRASEQRRAEVQAAADAEAASEAAEDVERSEYWAAVRADRARMVAAKIVSQSDLNMLRLARKLAAGCEETLRDQIAAGWSFEPGPRSLGPAPDFAIMGVTEDSE